MNKMQSCKAIESKLPDLLFGGDGPAAVPAPELAKVRSHVAVCDSCRGELNELKATMAAMDAWTAPEPSPYFFTRLNARMREEREAAPAGWLNGTISRLRAGLLFGPHSHVRPVAAMALTVMLFVGGGTYLEMTHMGTTNWNQPAQATSEEAVVHDLQTLNNNAQVLDTLENLSNDNGE
jgi:hypothetical protein